MRIAYRVLAYLVALEVVIQAGAIAFAVFGLAKWIQDGGVMDKATVESGSTQFTGLIGFPVHGINGQMIIPALAVLLLIVSLFAKVPQGVMWAGLVVVLVAAQVFLGTFGRGIPVLGLLHGINALVLFVVAWIAARRAGSTAGLTVGADQPSNAQRAGFSSHDRAVRHR